MAQNIDDLTIEYEEDGTILVKELDKEVLSKGAWTTILFRYQDMDRNSGQYGPDKFTIRRYRKMGGQFRQQSKFNISSQKQAAKICQALEKWLHDEG